MPRTRKQRAGAMPLSYVDKHYLEPSGPAGSNLNVSQVGLARPVLNLTGGSRDRRSHRRSHKRSRVTRKRVMRGGFFPGVMGAFIQNAKSLLPVTAVTGYRMFKNFNKTAKNRY